MLFNVSLLRKRDAGIADEAHTSGIEHDKKNNLLPIPCESDRFSVASDMFQHSSFVNLGLYFNLKVKKL